MRISLDSPLDIREICDALHTQAPGSALGKAIMAISTDTREAIDGDLFIALDGDNASGEDYVSEAISKGCIAISARHREGVISVKNTSDALLALAKLYKSNLNIKHTVAVTGSVGKSTTVKFLSRILSKKYKVHSTAGNFNNHIGVPLTVLSAPADTEILVVELGMNHRGEISRLSKCIEPTLGIITAIGSAHIGNLGSREEIALAKLEIQDGMKDGSLLLPYGELLLSSVKNAKYVARESSLSSFSLNRETDTSYTLLSEYGSISGISFFDTRSHLVDDLALCISASQMLGLSKDEIISGVNAINESDIRQRFIVLNGYTVFDDSYNSSLESVIADLVYIKSLGKPTGAFLGDVLELGDMSAEIHARIGKEAARIGIDHLYLYGRYADEIARGALSCGMKRQSIFINTELSSPEISVRHIKENHLTNEIILFKASHKLRLDKIADTLKNEEGINDDSY